MIIRSGIDLVKDERIKKNLENTAFLNRIFHPSELTYLYGKRPNPKRLCSIFAIKEATFKALNTKVSWLDIEIIYHKNKSNIILSKNLDTKHIISIDSSVSHEDGYTIAMVTILQIKNVR